MRQDGGFAAPRAPISLTLRGWRAWSSPRAGAAARALTLGAGATLFLNSAATVHAGYTIRVPYALLGAACAIGFPAVVEGWRRAPSWLGWTAFALLAIYVVAAIDGTGATLGVQRAGGHRDLVYLADLALGIATVGLILGLWRDRPREQLLTALAVAAGLAGAYAAYQWPARHFGLPLSDLNNTLDSNGVTTGRSQGSGLLGWERARGTFLEPHFLGAFLAALFPISAYAAWTARGRVRILAAAGAAAVSLGLIVAVSAPAYGSVGFGLAVGAALFAIGCRRVAASGLLAALAVAMAVALPAVATSSRTLGFLTGRSGTELKVSANARSRAWEGAVRLWESRPVLGFGPGQSSIQLARQKDAAGSRPAEVLSSAQGLWAASLIDAGVLGFGAWALFIGGVIAIGGSRLLLRPSPLSLVLFAATTSIVVSSELAGDRLETTAWVLFGVLLATASSREDGGETGDRRQEPGRTAGQRREESARAALRAERLSG